MTKETALTRGTLVRRYKRFLADVILADGRQITVHCPNTGSMKNCVFPGADVWLEYSDNPKRKYAYTWVLTRTPGGHHIGINTTAANALVEKGIQSGLIAELAGYSTCQREVVYGMENSRVDFFLGGHTSLPDCYVEVKSVTLLEKPTSAGNGFFPDAVSTRAAKHLRELIDVRRQGFRAVIFFCVQHTGIKVVRPADHIDPAYGELLREAAAQGVEIIAYKARLSQQRFRLWRKLPSELT